MARLTAGIGEAYYAIKRWKGVNENPDGDTNLKDGEAAVMRNFRITDGGALRKRPGSDVVAGLLASYSLTISDTEEVVLVEKNRSTFSADATTNATVNDKGEIVLVGDRSNLNYENNSEFVDYFYNSPEPTKAWRHTRVVYEEAQGDQRCDGGAVNLGEVVQDVMATTHYQNPWGPVYIAYSAELGKLKITDGKYALDSVQKFTGYEEISKAVTDGFCWWVRPGSGVLYKLSPSRGIENPGYGIVGMIYSGQQIAGLPLDDVYTWYGKPVGNAPNAGDSVVRGIWSGFVGDTEYIVAACNNHLWSLAETNGEWSKEDIGGIDTSDHVCLFGFDSKLYCLDGKEYRVWDGKNFTEVDGYIPLLANATPPSGGGTLLERANMLTPKRRQRFSADGTAKEFKLLESNIQMVDSATVNGAAVQFTADTASGKVTFNSAPAAGTDNVEITWTAKESSRENVVKMRYAEFYNGANDSRVFLYGDGSNITFYSDITEAGAASAEYFPALNEIAVGDSNTPLTSLIRQYSRLMAFKSGGSAWSIYYDAITLADGSVTAGFYCNPVNKSIGNAALGQAVLVENKPRTLDGRSIYEWQSASGGYITNDQRNAQRISQKVENTLLGFDLSQCVMFFDKIKHEFYCVYGDKAVVQNTENGAWYIYTNFPAAALIVHKDELYYGTPNGDLRKFSDEYTGDSGNPIDAYWESGSLSFGRDYILKYSPTVWVGLKQEDNAAVEVGIETDQEAPIYEAISLPADVDAMPRMNRAKLKAKKFTYYKLLFKSHTADTKATVVAADVRVKYNINVK